MALGNDPDGGINTIAASAAMHQTDDDRRWLEGVFDRYSTGAKGTDGTPNGDRWLEKYHASLACEEIIRTWATVSDGAVEKFVKDHFDNTWNRWDQYTVGHIDMAEAIPMVRELMDSLAPSVPQPTKNPYEFDYYYNSTSKANEILLKGTTSGTTATSADSG